MHYRHARISFRGVFAGLTLGLLVATATRAQAWLPPKGEAWLSFGYGNVLSTRHYLGTVDPGENPELNRGSTRTQSVGLQLGYGITDRLALSVAIPFVDSRYQGAYPHKLGGVTLTPDDGLYHGTFQDYRINLGYQLFSGDIAVAPFATAVIPSHSYATLSHAAPGKGLNQYLLGVSAGGALNRILPGSYVQASYDYAFVEDIAGINTNRSDFGFELGYFLTSLTPSLGVRFLAAGHYTHDGIAYKAPSPQYLDPALFRYHDQIAKTNGVAVGGGLSYTLTGSTEVSLSYLTSVYGRGGHKLNQGLSVGFSWSFSPEQIIRQYFPPKKSTNPMVATQ